MKTRVKVIWVAITTLALVVFVGCTKPQAEALNPSDYPDPPMEEHVDALPLYIAWDGAGGESWEYKCSPEGIIEEDNEPPRPEPSADEDGMTIIEEMDPPGGRTVWFYGTAPGDVVIKFTTQNNKGQVVDIQQYAIRVYDDLKLVLLHMEQENFRE